MKEQQPLIAIVTGGASGIGLAIAEKFSQHDIFTIVVGRDSNKLKAAQDMLGKNGKTFQFDLTDLKKIPSLVNDIKKEFGRIDVLVNNAGITKDAMLKKLAIEDFHRVIDVNLTGVFHCTQAALPYIEKSTAGRIINTTSVSGVYGNVGQTNYSAAKAGVIGATKALAQEVGRRGITVNAVAPGFIKTDMTGDLDEKELKAMIPVKRFGLPEEVAHAVGFLASADAGYITGEVLSINGGLYS
jgi:3-oxoacyl-[acyl-carrier protein] reductase